MILLMRCSVSCTVREPALQSIPYFLEYSPGLKLNPVSNWTLVNLPLQIEKIKSFFLSLDFNPLSIWTWVIMDHEIN